MKEKQEILLVDEQSLKDKVYSIRGVQVMLDVDLAKIYGYTTKRFNEQVKNNIEKFPEDFRFQLSQDDMNNLRSKISTSSWGGQRYLPYAFSEQGIYMLMTVLRGELATYQSIKLIRLFKEMKNHLINNQFVMNPNSYLSLIERVQKHDSSISDIENKMVTKKDLTNFMKLFDSGVSEEEILILDGQPFKADIAYQRIYRKAKKSIILIDDYINIKTLHHLATVQSDISITIISDNKSNSPLRQSEYQDYQKEYPERIIVFLQSKQRVHDRYIILDNDTKNMKVYLCGSSSKDSGKRITTIIRIKDTGKYPLMLKSLLGNHQFVLK